MVPVGGVPLVEHNLVALLRAGIRRVVAVVGSGTGADLVGAWAGTRGLELAKAAGGQLDLLIEPSAMGNAGALALVVRGPDDLLVLVFADNLTSLDLGALVDAHGESGADLTLAVHTETFPLPYGIVDQVDGRVTGYREKPQMPVEVGSGIAVVGARAIDAMQARPGPHGVIDLVLASLAAGLDVRAVQHTAAWIDVNDAQSRDRADALVRSDPAAFSRSAGSDLRP
jgi:NDP-sugar pyrophosphorylase family protein